MCSNSLNLFQSCILNVASEKVQLPRGQSLEPPLTAKRRKTPRRIIQIVVLLQVPYAEKMPHVKNVNVIYYYDAVSGLFARINGILYGGSFFLNRSRIINMTNSVCVSVISGAYSKRGRNFLALKIA